MGAERGGAHECVRTEVSIEQIHAFKRFKQGENIF